MFPHLRALAAFVTEAKFAFGKHFAFAKMVRAEHYGHINFPLFYNRSVKYVLETSDPKLPSCISL